MLFSRKMKFAAFGSAIIFCLVWFALPSENNAEVSKGAKGPKVTDKVCVV